MIIIIIMPPHETDNNNSHGCQTHPCAAGTSVCRLSGVQLLCLDIIYFPKAKDKPDHLPP